MDMNTLNFILNDVHGLEEILQKERFADYDKEAIDLFLQGIKDYADKDLYPVFREVDEDPARFEDGKIYTHPAVKTVMQKAGEMGIIGALFDNEDGGLQMPLTVVEAASYIMSSANNHLTGYPGLTAGAADLIVTFGSQELKDKYVPNMIAGEWGGTMCLTEPQAGSSLSDAVTSASPQEDGSFKIKGQKIFISGGDHEHASNFVHLVLARIEGAPAGTKGISLFVVPKKRINDDGSMESNDVITAGDYQKMGQRGYCTTHLVFGENDDCQGWLVGQPHNGLRYMFQMMNGARIAVGRDGAAVATAAYYASLQYANERPQGRRLSNGGKKDLSQGQTLIINHPDVRRMLLLQKAVSEASLSLVLQGCKYFDLEDTSEGEEKERNNLLLEMLTPIIKTYPSEMGRISVNNGLQVLGGYGFCSEFVLQQYARDIRIMAIYEGTTGIQSQDLLGRKVTMKGGEGLRLLAGEMMETIKSAMTYDDLRPAAGVLGEKLQQAQKVIEHLMAYAMKGNYERYLSDATIFMEMFGTIVIGWQWLKMGVQAKQALVTGKTEYPASFYEGKLHTMKFFYKYEMPRTNSLAEILMNEETLTIVEEKELIS